MYSRSSCPYGPEVYLLSYSNLPSMEKYAHTAKNEGTYLDLRPRASRTSDNGGVVQGVADNEAALAHKCREHDAVCGIAHAKSEHGLLSNKVSHSRLQLQVHRCGAYTPPIESILSCLCQIPAVEHFTEALALPMIASTVCLLILGPTLLFGDKEIPNYLHQGASCTWPSHKNSWPPARAVCSTRPTPRNPGNCMNPG